jgi:hypothetical protein
MVEYFINQSDINKPLYNLNKKIRELEERIEKIKQAIEKTKQPYSRENPDGTKEKEIILQIYPSKNLEDIRAKLEEKKKDLEKEKYKIKKLCSLISGSIEDNQYIITITSELGNSF